MDTIRMYVENLFAGLPQSEELLKAKEELLAMMEDKYHELKSQGKNENEAVGVVISEFGNIDELLDELGINKEPSSYNDDNDNTANYRKVTFDEAKDYIAHQFVMSKRIALGVFLCVISPITLIVLGGLSEGGPLKISEAASSAIGLTMLFLLVAAGVAIFIINGIASERFEYVTKEPLQLDESTRRYVNEQMNQYNPVFAAQLTIGIILCIISVVPIIVAGCVVEDIPANDWISACCVGVLLLIVAVGTAIIITCSMKKTSYEQLLQTKDYSISKKTKSTLADKIGSVYWPLVTVGYLAWSFITKDWGFTWIVWPIAGVLFGVIAAICNLIGKDNQ